MTISFRAGDDEEDYREFCDEIGIGYSEVPKNIIKGVANDPGAREDVENWLNSDESSFLQYVTADVEKSDEAFNRIRAGLEYGLDDQVVEGVEMLNDSNYRYTEAVIEIIGALDDEYKGILDQG